MPIDFRIPVHCTNHQCGIVVSGAGRPPTRAVRTWCVAPQVINHGTHVELRVGTKHLRCQECGKIGAIGRPEHGDTSLEELHHP